MPHVASPIHAASPLTVPQRASPHSSDRTPSAWQCPLCELLARSPSRGWLSRGRASLQSTQADPARVEAAAAAFSSMVSAAARPPDTVQACMRPCPPDALPIMGKVRLDSACADRFHQMEWRESC
jgi:hypothetical protein